MVLQPEGTSGSVTARLLEVHDLGRRSYQSVLDLQRAMRLARLDGSLSHDALLLVEHDPVFTLGRGTRDSSLPFAPDALRAHGADVIEIERGGDVTWHGPGQLVGYPIIDLTRHRADLHWYLRTIEQSLIDALAVLGIAAARVPEKTGVWVDDRKIASIGIHVKRWVTLHGFALNVDADLNWFRLVVPCGLTGVTMTSVARELGPHAPDSLDATVRQCVVAAFAKSFDLDPRVAAKPLP